MLTRLSLVLIWGLSLSVRGAPYEQYGSLESGPGYEDLKSLIRSENISGPDELLASFARNSVYQKFLEYFTLVYKSGSLQRQDVSFEYPRVISHFGRLVLGMTGKPPSKGGKHFHRLEIIEFQPQSSRFALHEIDFRKKGEERFVDTPVSCRNCHGKRARPIWATYPLWPGVYGGNDDTLSPEREPIEAAEWSKFYEGNRREGRYAHFRLGALYNFDDKNPRFDPDGLTRFVPSMPLATRENLRLSSHLSAMNERRILSELTQPALWSRYKFALVAAVLDCDRIDEMLTGKLRGRQRASSGMSYDALLREILEKVRANDARKRALFLSLTGSTSGIRPSLDLSSHTRARSPFLKETNHFSVLTKLRFLIEGQSIDPSLNVGNWGLDFDPQDSPESFALDSTYQSLESLPLDMYRIAQADPNLSDLREDILMVSVRHERLCASLREKSLETTKTETNSSPQAGLYSSF